MTTSLPTIPLTAPTLHGDDYLNQKAPEQAGGQQISGSGTAAPGQAGVPGSIQGPATGGAIPGQQVIGGTTSVAMADENPFGYNPISPLSPTSLGSGTVDAYHSGLGYGQPDTVPENTAEVPAIQEAAEEAFVDEDIYQDFGGGDDNGYSAPETRRDHYGNVYRVGSASDPYASQRGGGLPFELPGTEDLPFPGVTGAILGGVSGLSNRNLDNIQQQTAAGTEGYSYGTVGTQRFGTSPGLIPGTTVVSGPSELRGLGINTTVPNTAANQQALLEAAEQDTYKSVSGNTFVGQAATNKREADEEAQARGYGSAVTDSSGKAVRSSDGTVVTSGGRIQQEEESISHGGQDDDGGGGGGK